MTPLFFAVFFTPPEHTHASLSDPPSPFPEPPLPSRPVDAPLLCLPHHCRLLEKLLEGVLKSPFFSPPQSVLIEPSPPHGLRDLDNPPPHHNGSSCRDTTSKQPLLLPLSFFSPSVVGPPVPSSFSWVGFVSGLNDSFDKNAI